MIYLHQNSITKIENLNHLTNLVTINLSHNMIEKIEGLEGLVNLKNLDLQQNCLATVESLEELTMMVGWISFLRKSSASESNSLTGMMTVVVTLSISYS